VPVVLDRRLGYHPFERDDRDTPVARRPPESRVMAASPVSTVDEYHP
jgi:hypothetical protein